MSTTDNWHIYKNKNKTLAARREEGKRPPWREKKSSEAEEEYYYTSSPELLDAVNAAIYLRRPLLIMGDPGIGKTSLAKSIAKELTDKPLLKWHITSKSELKDALYDYDALARLYDIQMAQYNTSKRKKKTIDIKDYLTLGPLGEAFLDVNDRVVLIDEIDKSDIDLPNDMLHIFEEQEFTMPEVKRTGKEVTLDGRLTIPSSGVVTCQKDFPIIIMTSNGEREFSPAFLRRCIRFEMHIPEKGRKDSYKAIVKSHFKDKFNDKDEKLGKLIDIFIEKKYEKNKLLSNDQLLNAAYILLHTDEEVDSELFKEQILKSLE